MNLFKYFERAFDVQRVASNYAEYDQRRGYRAYHAYCRARSPLDGAPAAAEAPGQRGFELLKGLLSPAVATRLREDVTAAGEFGLLKKNARDLHGYRVRDAEAVASLLRTVLSPHVDGPARRFFGCHYLVHWFTVSTTPPAPQPPSISFRWHCDKGPREHLKLMVYLNDAAEHGGGTAFLDVADSAAVTASGYLFGRAKKRTSDLAVLAARTGRALAPIELRPACGDAVLFQPSTIVHRGIAPSRGPRYTLTVCLLPSPLPWAEALRRGTLSDLMEDELWHEDANALLRQLESSQS